MQSNKFATGFALGFMCGAGFMIFILIIDSLI